MPASSLAESLGLAMKAGMEAEGLTFGSPPVAVPVVVRKTPSLPAGTDPAQVVIYVAEESRSEEYDARHRLETFSAWVVFFTAGGQKLAFDSVLGGWRDAAKRRIDDLDRATFATLITGATIQKATQVGGKLPFDPAGLAKDLNVSAVAFEVVIKQARAT